MAIKRKKSGNESQVDIGMVMTVSLFLILLTFFILLNSIAVLDERRTRVAIGSLLGAFGTLPGGLSALKTGETILPPSAPMVMEEMDVPQLMAIMDKTIARYIKIEKLTSGEKITINEKALFKENKLSLTPSIIPFLDKLCKLLKRTAYTMEIVSHTDNLPAETKGYHSNWELTALMANQLMKYFIEKDADLNGRITAYGFSSVRPIAPNYTRQSRTQNRRVDIILNWNGSSYIRKVYKKKPSGFFTYKKFDFKLF
jgi:chemotaxis protein MotB